MIQFIPGYTAIYSIYTANQSVVAVNMQPSRSPQRRREPSYKDLQAPIRAPLKSSVPEPQVRPLSSKSARSACSLTPAGAQASLNIPLKAQKVSNRSEKTKKGTEPVQNPPTDLSGRVLAPRPYVHLRDKPQFYEAPVFEGKAKGEYFHKLNRNTAEKVEEAFKHKPGRRGQEKAQFDIAIKKSKEKSNKGLHLGEPDYHKGRKRVELGPLQGSIKKIGEVSEQSYKNRGRRTYVDWVILFLEQPKYASIFECITYSAFRSSCSRSSHFAKTSRPKNTCRDVG